MAVVSQCWSISQKASTTAALTVAPATNHRFIEKKSTLPFYIRTSVELLYENTCNVKNGKMNKMKQNRFLRWTLCVVLKMY